jgi:hypothetical protein
VEADGDDDVGIDQWSRDMERISLGVGAEIGRP